MSIATLRRYENRHITPTRDANGDHRFNPKDLDALAAKLRARTKRKPAAHRAGDVSSPRHRAPLPEPRVSGSRTKAAFEMFERDCTRAQVAMDLEECVENVNWLHENWLVMSGRTKEAVQHRRNAATLSDRIVGMPSAYQPAPGRSVTKIDPGWFADDWKPEDSDGDAATITEPSLG